MGRIFCLSFLSSFAHPCFVALSFNMNNNSKGRCDFDFLILCEFEFFCKFNFVQLFWEDISVAIFMFARVYICDSADVNATILSIS